MKESLLERHHLAVLATVLGLGVAITTLGLRAPDRLLPVQERGLALTAPVVSLGHGVVRWCQSAWIGLLDLRTSHSRLVRTERELRDLRILLDERRELAIENDRLRQLLDLAERTEHRSVAARVLHQERDTDRVLVIDRGTDHGILPDQAVVAPGGVVGKVLIATRRAAKVQCLVDPDGGVAVLVGEGRRQVQAVVRGGPDGRLRLRHVGPRGRLSVGEVVVTSGLDQVHPRGLVVGTVESVRDFGGLEREITLRPAVDFEQLEEVLVLAPEPAAPQRVARR
ncbi:MAG: rod shape-determining protein MreC [Acidobacteriota bacterium]